MRLIDADKLLETLQDLEPHCENKDYEYGMLNTMRYYMTKIINDEPTAFDTEKVVEQLESELRLADKEKERCVRENPLQFDSAKGYANGVANSIEIVKQEAEQYNNGWIPCSERLPKYGEVVMCSCTNSGITISCITHKGVKPSKSVRFGQHSVIAWQPLPLPYQPKGE